MEKILRKKEFKRLTSIIKRMSGTFGQNGQKETDIKPHTRTTFSLGSAKTK